MGAPDFLYAALHFSILIWQSGEATGRDEEASAGYKFANFALSYESPDHDPLWAAKLLRDFYEAAVAEQQEGGISDKERSLLIRLRDSLGNSPTDAETLERELVSGSIAHRII
jgi:hypothetical protein